MDKTLNQIIYGGHILKHNDYVSTSYVYDRQNDRFLLIFHKKLNKWLPPGGHLMEGEPPHVGALRELTEEIGVEGQIIELLKTPEVDTKTILQFPSPFCVLYETIPAQDGGEDQHMHIDFVYVVEVDPSATLIQCLEEISSAKWFSLNQIDSLDTYENVIRVCQAIVDVAKRR